jgi:hypothetical protein
MGLADGDLALPSTTIGFVGSTAIWGGVDYDGIIILTATNGFLYELDEVLFVPGP